MILNRMAADLDKIRQNTEAFAVAVGGALTVLSVEKTDVKTARHDASTIIAAAIAGKESLEYRCQNLALLVRKLALLPTNTPPEVYDEIWSDFLASVPSG